MKGLKYIFSLVIKVYSTPIRKLFEIDKNPPPKDSLSYVEEVSFQVKLAFWMSLALSVIFTVVASNLGVKVSLLEFLLILTVINFLFPSVSYMIYSTFKSKWLRSPFLSISKLVIKTWE